MYIEKLNEILEKLSEKPYVVNSNEIPIDNLLEYIENQMLSFPDYANIVIREQIMIPIWQRRFEPDEIASRTMEIDRQRRNAHNVAIGAVNGLNRICANLGIEPFANIDTNDRYVVAEFVGNFVGEVYNMGIGKSFEQILSKSSEYETRELKDFLATRKQTYFSNEDTER